MKAKVLNSLRSELAKMDLEDKNKAGMSKTVEGLKIMLNTSRDYQNEFLKKIKKKISNNLIPIRKNVI